MRLNHEYWCEPECTWQTNSIKNPATSERLDSWTSRHWRGIELVFKWLDCFTVWPIFSTRLITRMKSFTFFYFIVSFVCVCGCVCVCVCVGGGVLTSNAFTIWCCIQISRPLRVFRRHFSITGYFLNGLYIWNLLQTAYNFIFWANKQHWFRKWPGAN